MTQRNPRFEIQGQTVTLPCIVTEASSAAATYLVDARAARALLPEGSRLEIAEAWPGKALFSIACIDYRENDLGDYNEVSVALFVREPGSGFPLPYLGTFIDLMRGKLGTYIHWLPVDQGFTREAGEVIWGFPKTVEQIDREDTPGRSRFRLTAGGQHVLTLSFSTEGTRSMPDQNLTTYTMIHGVPHRTQFVSGATETGFARAGAELTLGDHPYADLLRGLGLPKSPLFTAWMGRMHGRFEAPEKR